MKYRTDDIVYFDDNPGIVICGYPYTLPGTNTHMFAYDVKWLAHGNVEQGVWESDLMGEYEYIETWLEP